MNVKIESGANVQITDKTIVNVYGDLVQHKNVYTHPEKNNTNTDDAKGKAAILTENKEFMRIMQKAVEAGFCEQDGWQYRWDVKVEAAYFASVASYTFGLSKKRDHDGDECISWKPFEALFGLKDLRLSYNDYQKCATKVKRKNAIDGLFK